MIEVLLNSYPSDKHKIKKKSPLYIPLSFIKQLKEASNQYIEVRELGQQDPYYIVPTEYTTSMDYNSTNCGSTTVYYSPTYTVRRT
jgi:hypothetical protein